MLFKFPVIISFENVIKIDTVIESTWIMIDQRFLVLDGSAWSFWPGLFKSETSYLAGSSWKVV